MKTKAGYTLLELLAAVAVLSVMVVLLGQMLGVTARTTSLSRQQLNATREARAVLDSLQEDLEHIVTEHEAATIFVKPDGLNSTVTFLTRRRAPSGMADVRFLAVTYKLQGTQLMRNVSGVEWSDVDLVSEAFPAPNTDLSGNIANGILRFEIVLLLDNGEFVPLSASGTWTTDKWNDVSLPETFAALRLTGVRRDPAAPKVRALTVAVAAIDPDLLSRPNVAEAANELKPAASGGTPLESWNAVIDSGKLAAESPGIAAAIRTLQATFPLRP
jgi:prepilin-type N-terminal cleavage/methylation domain-containing protein